MAYVLEIDGEEVTKSDDALELYNAVEEELKGEELEWQIWDDDTGEIVYTWDEEGSEDTGRSKERLGKDPGWDHNVVKDKFIKYLRKTQEDILWLTPDQLENELEEYLEDVAEINWDQEQKNQLANELIKDYDLEDNVGSDDMSDPEVMKAFDSEQAKMSFLMSVETNIGEFADVPPADAEDAEMPEHYINLIKSHMSSAAAEALRVTAERRGINIDDARRVFEQEHGMTIEEYGSEMGEQFALDNLAGARRQPEPEPDPDDDAESDIDTLFASYEPTERNLKEALEDYDNKIENAIQDVLGVEEDEAKEISKKMNFQDYLDFAMAVEREELETAEDVVQKYYDVVPMESLTYESIAQEIHYLTRLDEDNIAVPRLKVIDEASQRAVLNELTFEQQKKLLANLRGYAEPGYYESSLFGVHLVEDIINKLKDVKFKQFLEAEVMKPGEQQRTQAYGADTEVDSGEKEDDTKAKKATYKNEKGETVKGEVISQAGDNVKVKTDSGVKDFSTSDVIIEMDRIKELAGIKKK